MNYNKLSKKYIKIGDKLIDILSPKLNNWEILFILIVLFISFIYMVLIVFFKDLNKKW